MAGNEDIARQLMERLELARTVLAEVTHTHTSERVGLLVYIRLKPGDFVAWLPPVRDLTRSDMWRSPEAAQPTRRWRCLSKRISRSS